MNNKKETWEISYQKKDNFVFYPNEEIIRFFSKYITKRVGLNSFERRTIKYDQTPRVLDLGCGIGRHVIFSNTMQTESFGIDLAQSAIEVALEWAKREGIKDADKRIVQGDITQMPFENNFFDFIISHGVLDSMPINIARQSAFESARVLKKDSFFYCDLIAADSQQPENFSGEKVVDSEHEKGTVQLYYNEELINDIFGELYSIEELSLIKKIDIKSSQFISRYHIVFKKK